MKKLIPIICIIIIIIFVSILFIFKKDPELSIEEENALKFNCKYEETDPIKTTTYNYIINTDEFALINEIEHKITYKYNEESVYKEAKEYFETSNMKQLKYNDEKKEIIDSYYIEKGAFNNKSYDSYTKELDNKYICDKLEFKPITYECVKNETEFENVSETYTIKSDNKMNIDNMRKYMVIKFDDDESYQKNKTDIDIIGKTYDDDTKSIIYDQDVPMIGENGEKHITNIKNYIDNISNEYTCKILNN